MTRSSPFRLGLLAVTALAAPWTTASAETSAIVESDAGSVEEVIVLGTRRSDVTAFESSAPVDIVGAQAIQRIAATDISEALQRVSPSVNFPQGAVSPMGAGNGKSVSLRGLSPDQTLVLVNGKRLVASANITLGSPPVWGYGAQAVDINTIPLAAVERLEVLRDGAAAQYGSDAIAGVVNIVLRSASSGGDVSAQIGQYRNSADELTQSYSAWAGFALPSDGFLTVAYNAQDATHPKSGRPDPRQQYFTGDPREATYDRNSHWWGYPPSLSSQNLLVNAGIDLAPDLEAYGYVSYADIEKIAGTNHRTARDDANVRDLFQDGGNPFLNVRSEAATGAAGLRWTAGSLGDFDFSVNYGRYEQTSISTNTPNATLGLASPLNLRTGSNRNELFSVGADWVKPVAVGFLASPLTASAGVAYRRERYENIAGERAAWIDGGVPILDGPNAGNRAPTPSATTPEDAGVYRREVTSVYAGLEGEVLPNLEVGLTGRAENYSDFGSATTGKISARYEFTPDFALRATASTGYRAPSLGQVGYATTAGSVVPGTADTVKNRSFAVDSPVARLLGAQDLEPEKAVNYSVGLVWRPLPRASITLDAYQIEVEDKIALSQDFQGTAVRNLLIAAGYPDITIARFFTNALDTRTRGIELVARYGFTVGAGDLDLSLGYSKNETKVTHIDTTTVAGVTSSVVGLQAIWMLEEAPPSDKLVVGATYALGGLTVAFTQKRYGEYTESLSATAPTLQTYSPQLISDLDVTWRFERGVYAGIGAKNLFDTKPDEQWASNSRLAQTRYSNLAPEGFDGAFYYVKLGYAF